MINTIGRKFAKARKIGITNIALCFFERGYISILQRIFQFDPWHSKGTWSCRPYKAVAVKLVDSVKPATVVEVGCGLGEIISRVNAVNRGGYDIDGNVIKAARFIHGKKVAFRVGSTESIEEDAIDVLICINWIHNLSPTQLEELLLPLLSRVNYLLTESIDPSVKGYQYHHDFQFLRNLADKKVSEAGGLGEKRTIHLFKVIKS